MNALAERIAAFLRKTPSRAHCFPWLKTALNAAEPDLRQAAQVVIVQAGFRLADQPMR